VIVDDLDQIDLYDERLLQSEIVGLSLCKDRIQRYVHDGLIHEAEGATRVLQIMWQSLTGEEPIDTGWGRI
jgi:hypothetical protein